MEYEKTINFFDNTSSQLSEFKTKNWVEINGELYRMYKIGSQINCYKQEGSFY